MRCSWARGHTRPLVELQELSLKTVWTQLRFRPSSRIADIRGQIAEELSKAHELPEWGWGEDVAHVFSSDRTTNLIVTGRELRAGFDKIERLDDLRQTITSFLSYGLDVLGVEEVMFLGVRSYWLAAVDSFDELRDWLIASFSGGAAPLLEALGDSPTDAGWVYEFHKQDPKQRLQFGPMKQAQLVEGVLTTDSSEGIPPEFLFVDMDRVYNDKPTEVGRVIERWSDSFQRTLDLGERLGGIFSTAPEA
jgi:hypothetical protein